jgi:hypothetical protein
MDSIQQEFNMLSVNTRDITTLPIYRYIKAIIIITRPTILDALAQVETVDGIVNVILHKCNMIEMKKYGERYSLHMKRTQAVTRPNANLVCELDFTQLNGLIFDIHGNVLVVPLRGFRSYTLQRDVHPHALKSINVADYIIQKAVDGTIITFYHDPDATSDWHISTIRGIVMENKSLYGRERLINIVNAVYRSILEKNNVYDVEIQSAKVTDSLDPNYCYTFQLSHPEWNPGVAERDINLVFIQSVNVTSLDSENCVSVSKSSLPYPLNRVISEPVTVAVPASVKTLSQFVYECVTDDDMYGINTTNISGYIFRYQQAWTSTAIRSFNTNDMFFENKRSKILRHYIYSQVYMCRNIRELATKYYISLLGHQEQRELCLACQQFSLYFQHCEYYMGILLELIYALYSSNDGNPTDIQVKSIVARFADTYNTPIRIISVFVVAANFFIVNVIKNNVAAIRNNKSIVRDLIMEQKHLPIYIKLFDDAPLLPSYH